jgi:hypothetical protein
MTDTNYNRCNNKCGARTSWGLKREWCRKRWDALMVKRHLKEMGRFDGEKAPERDGKF